jgi:replication initiation and membrane attachment protein DnaB
LYKKPYRITIIAYFSKSSSDYDEMIDLLIISLYSGQKIDYGYLKSDLSNTSEINSTIHYVKSV